MEKKYVKLILIIVSAITISLLMVSNVILLSLHGIKYENSTGVEITNKDSIRVEDPWSKPLFIAATITIVIAFIVLFFGPKVESREIKSKLYALLLLALSETRRDLTNKGRIESYGGAKKIKNSQLTFIKVYLDLSPYEVIFNTDFFAHLKLKTQNDLSTLFSNLKLNNDLFNRKKNLEDFEYLFNLFLTKKTNVEYNNIMPGSPIDKYDLKISIIQTQILNLIENIEKSIENKIKNKYYTETFRKEHLDEN